MDEYLFGACDSFLEKILVEGTSVLAEILSLADHIPSDFKDPSKSKFRPYILDFAYFAKAQDFEKQLTSNQSLQDVFYASFGTLLSRFEQLFQSVANFIITFNEYCDSVSSDRRANEFLNRTHELEVECLYTLGLIVMYIEKYIPGLIRERLFIAIFRNSDERNNIEFLVDFLRVLEGSDTLYKRAFRNTNFVNGCISMLHNENYEVSSKISVTFRRKRTEKLFVILNFDIGILHGDAGKMRHIVDHFFRDQWVLCLGFGAIVNVLDAWQPFKAASSALSSVVNSEKAQQLSSMHYKQLSDISVPQGEIEPCKFAECMKIIQDYNNSLRWLVLHSYDKCGRRGSQILQTMPAAAKFEKAALSVVLKISKFEAEFIKVYKNFLEERVKKIEETKEECAKLLTELSSFFAHGFTSLKVDKKENLNNWLQLLKKAVEEVKVENVSQSVEVVGQIKRRIAQVGIMLDLRGNYAISQYLEKISSQLDSLTALFVVSEKIVQSVELSADSDYLWPLMDEWTPRIQERLLSSATTHPVRTIFHKLGIALSVMSTTFGSKETVRRITRCLSFYLERRLKNVLQSVPSHLFMIMSQIVQPSLKLKFNAILEKTDTKALADFDENFRLAEATYTISNMSVGISRMSLKKIGTIDVNPKNLLEDGIRKELSKKIHEELLIQQKDPSLTDVLKKTESIRSLKEAFIYACEHMDVNGYDMWREEMEAHCQDVLDDRMNKTTEIRRKSSIGQPTLDYIISSAYKLTNPSTSRYQPHEMAWTDLKKIETFSIQNMASVETLIPALRIFDEILAHDLRETLNECVTLWSTTTAGATNFELDPDVFKSTQLDQINRAVQANWSVLSNSTAKVGQILLLRKIVNEARRSEANKKAASVVKVVAVVDEILSNDVTKLPEAAFLVSKMVKWLGLQNVEKIPIALSRSPDQLSLPILLFLVFVGPKLKVKPPVCPASLIAGVHFLVCQTSQSRSVDEFLQWNRLHEAFTKGIVKKKRPMTIENVTNNGFAVSLLTSLVV